MLPLNALAYSLLLLTALPAAKAVEEQPGELHILDENLLKVLVNPQLARYFNVNAVRPGNTRDKQPAAMEIKPVFLPNDEIAPKPIEKPSEKPIEAVNLMAMNRPLSSDKLPTSSAFSHNLHLTVPTNALPNLPHLLPQALQQLLAKPAAVTAQPTVATTPTSACSQQPFYPAQNQAYFSGYPSFIIINPGNFAPHFITMPNGLNNPLASPTPSNALRSTNAIKASLKALRIEKQTTETLAAKQRAAVAESDNDTTHTESILEPIFITAPEHDDPESADDTVADTGDSMAEVTEQSRATPTSNALLEFILKSQPRRRLQEGLAALYLREYNLNKK